MRTRKQMFFQYLKELYSISGSPLLTREQQEQLYRQCFMDGAQWIDITNGKGQVIGFIIIATHPNCHPDADWYIQETYIVPEYRNQGYMSRWVSKWLSEVQATICLFILNKNTCALRFWQHIFHKNNYVPVHLADVIYIKDCTQYGFKPK